MADSYFGKRMMKRKEKKRIAIYSVQGLSSFCLKTLCQALGDRYRYMLIEQEAKNLLSPKQKESTQMSLGPVKQPTSL